LSATATGQVKTGHSVGAEARIDFWRLRLYSAGFLAAFALHLAANGLDRWPALSIMTVAAMSAGLWRMDGRWLRAGVVLGVVHALAFPILEQAMASGDSIAAVVAKAAVWPQLLVTLIGSRVLSSEGELSFSRFWRHPLRRGAAIEMQSIPSAVALGSFLTLVFYLAVPHALTPGEKQTSTIIVSAMLGGTIVHSAIVFLFFVIISSILDAARLHIVDRSVVASFGRLVEARRMSGAARDPLSILAGELSSAAHTRAARLLNAAIEAGDGDGLSSRARLAALSFDGFQMASRQFMRALLPLLPLLGFLGTVIGLATAISELPRGLTDGAGHGFDVSASLAGLAVKFETTLLGLMASMIASLALNFLEKRETELAAECMLIVKDAGAADV
jgi:biopolymer transport protein ExbB/TolQ